MGNQHIRGIGPAGRTLIVLLVLALAAVWTGGQFLAAPCAMSAAGTAASAPGTDGPRKSEHASCLGALACCQAAPNVLAPAGSAWLPADWRQIAYLTVTKSLTGLHPKPELPPPTILG